MLVRNGQIDEFKKQSEKDFVEEVANDLRENHPDKVAGIEEQELRRRVEYGLGKAQRYEMTGKYPIAMFIELMFIAAPDFDEYPLINSILKDTQISPNERIDEVVNQMNEQRWQNVKSRSKNEWKVKTEAS